MQVIPWPQLRPSSSVSPPPHLKAAMDIPKPEKNQYHQFSQIAFQHKDRFPDRRCGGAAARIGVPLGWIGQAMKPGSSCPPSLKRLYQQNQALCDAIFHNMSQHVQQARLEIITKTGLLQIQDYLCHVSMGIIESGAEAQPVHTDWDQLGPPNSYWTLALPITTIPNQGTTEFSSRNSKFFTSYKGSYIWQGHARHRGGANQSNGTRVVVFFVFIHKEHPFASPEKDDNNPHNHAIMPPRSGHCS